MVWVNSGTMYGYVFWYAVLLEFDLNLKQT